MRLLNTTTMLLEPKEFFGDQIPRYAILSHQWKSEEVTFRDINEPRAKRMKGYAKIKFTCDQARMDGYQYAWVDTCCIDKSSSAELSEAINSMYQWYKDAALCYAYLEDVKITHQREVLRPEKAGGEAYNAAFAASSWFSRGWTLQELLAPDWVTFYGAGWALLGNKTALASTISSATSIPITVLVNPHAVHRSSVAARMSWASKRETTRTEDIAYCLLGLFGVNMPLLYGEGLRAFRRLQEELIRISDDESLFAWQQPDDYPHYYTQYRNMAFLAPHPSWFTFSGKIVPQGRRHHTKPYSLTNKGLQMQVLLTPRLHSRDSTDDTDFRSAILNCQFEDDFSTFIALPLWTYSTF
jgi:hypothetical protein